MSNNSIQLYSKGIPVDKLSELFHFNALEVHWLAVKMEYCPCNCPTWFSLGYNKTRRHFPIYYTKPLLYSLDRFLCIPILCGNYEGKNMISNVIK